MACSELGILKTLVDFVREFVRVTYPAADARLALFSERYEAAARELGLPSTCMIFNTKHGRISSAHYRTMAEVIAVVLADIRQEHPDVLAAVDATIHWYWMSRALEWDEHKLMALQAAGCAMREAWRVFEEPELRQQMTRKCSDIPRGAIDSLPKMHRGVAHLADFIRDFGPYEYLTTEASESANRPLKAIFRSSNQHDAGFAIARQLTRAEKMASLARERQAEEKPLMSEGAGASAVASRVPYFTASSSGAWKSTDDVKRSLTENMRDGEFPNEKWSVRAVIRRFYAADRRCLDSGPDISGRRLFVRPFITLPGGRVHAREDFYGKPRYDFVEVKLEGKSTGFARVLSFFDVVFVGDPTPRSCALIWWLDAGDVPQVLPDAACMTYWSKTPDCVFLDSLIRSVRLVRVPVQDSCVFAFLRYGRANACS